MADNEELDNEQELGVVDREVPSSIPQGEIFLVEALQDADVALDTVRRR
jgi:hypothetical protein